MVLCEFMNSLRNYVDKLFVNTHVQINIDREFYHFIIYIASEGRHVRMPDKCGHKSTSDLMYIFFITDTWDSGIYIHLFIKIPLEIFVFFFLSYSFSQKKY